MSKIDDARDILEQLGLPPAQRNEISCLTLLALAALSEDAAWSEASKPSHSIHQILGFMRDTYGREYAENTRESVRRQVIHQFEQARLVDRNPDAPDLPTNSPRTHYGLTDEALNVLRLYQSGGWESELAAFRSSHGALLEIYQRRRQMREIPIRTSTGEEIRMSPGRHNRLQALVVTVSGRGSRRGRSCCIWATLPTSCYTWTGRSWTSLEFRSPSMTSCLTWCFTTKSGTGCSWWKRSRLMAQ